MSYMESRDILNNYLNVQEIISSLTNRGFSHDATSLVLVSSFVNQLLL
uniref:Uncharacterized protein n=1 Tax=Anguilla anguilla TaxID=7936 RepID=A0A0E9UCQ3_ANGAN